MRTQSTEEFNEVLCDFTVVPVANGYLVQGSHSFAHGGPSTPPVK